MNPGSDLREKVLSVAIAVLILLLLLVPWGADYFKGEPVFSDQKALLADSILTLTNLAVTLLLIYFLIQKGRSRQSENSELQRLSITDHLTQIYNSRFFHEQLKKEVERANRQKEQFALLFLDIDQFKKYNDLHGHTAGDDLLKEAGRIIRRMIREGVDCGARYGGDEFSVILIDSNLEAAYEIGERIRLAFYRSRNGNISLSMGIAAFRRGDTADRLFKRADHAMYHAKRKGGNRIEIESWALSTFSHYNQNNQTA